MLPCPVGALPYTIRPGDTLGLIARRFNTSVRAIQSLNPTLEETNLRVGQVICIPQECEFHRIPSKPLPEISQAELALNNQMRLLWEQHVYWTRLFIVSTAFDLPDLDPVTNRLLRNPRDFEAELRPLYGRRLAADFAGLLTSHLTIAAELVNAAKAGDRAAVAQAEKRWYENADEIAAFLGRINPNWSAQRWRSMLREHLAMTQAEAVDILTGKYEDSIRRFDKIEQQALMMADVMTQGIARQFPQNFR